MRRYFFLPHRNEPRGVGGIFFDYVGAGAEATAGEPAPPQPPFAGKATRRRCSRSCVTSATILDAYLPITERRRNDPWGERERNWQLLRRGRYVEFNLLYDRGTVFGLRTDGRVESILMSLPPEVRWAYGTRRSPGAPKPNPWPPSAPGVTGQRRKTDHRQNLAQNGVSCTGDAMCYSEKCGTSGGCEANLPCK